MIEQNAMVVGMEGEYVYLEADNRNTGCSSCSVASGCSTSIMVRLFGQRKNYVRVFNRLDVAVGESVVIGLQEKHLIRAAFRAYMLPLLFMVLAAAMAAVMGYEQGLVILASLAALAAGIAINSFMDNNTDGNESSIVLLRKTGSEVKLTDIQRSSG